MRLNQMEKKALIPLPLDQCLPDLIGAITSHIQSVSWGQLGLVWGLRLDLPVYCPLKGRCSHCKSALISANSVGKRKLCYANPRPKTIIGKDMRCTRRKKHFMSHDTAYVDSLPSHKRPPRDTVPTCLSYGSWGPAWLWLRWNATWKARSGSTTWCWSLSISSCGTRYNNYDYT